MEKAPGLAIDCELKLAVIPLMVWLKGVDCRKVRVGVAVSKSKVAFTPDAAGVGVGIGVLVGFG